MIKVVKEGKDLSNYVKLAVCLKCECEFLFERADVKTTTDFEEYTEHEYIYCPNPTCKSKISLETHAIV